MRKSIIQTQPYIALLTAPILGLIAWIRHNNTAELQVYDTYLVISMGLLAGIFIGILLLTSLFYWLTRQRTGLPQLTSAHVLGTIGIVIYLICTSGQLADSSADTGIPMSVPEYRARQDSNARFAMALVALATIQLLFCGEPDPEMGQGLTTVTGSIGRGILVRGPHQ